MMFRTNNKLCLQKIYPDSVQGIHGPFRNSRPIALIKTIKVCLEESWILVFDDRRPYRFHQCKEVMNVVHG